MKVEIKISGKKEDVKKLGERLYDTLKAWNREAKRSKKEKAGIDISEVFKMYNNGGKVN